jgi:general secretion pathway protein B
MSLILEALKKSEAERRLGRAPGLMDPQPRSRRRRRAGALRVALAVLLLAVAGGGYWFGLRSTPAPPADGLASAIETPDVADAATSLTAPAAAEPAAPPPAATPAAPTGAATGDAPSRLPNDPGFVSVEREARAQLPAALPAAAPPPALPAAPEPAPVPAPAPVSVPAPAPAPAPATGAVGPEAPPVETATPLPTPITTSEPSLDAATRAAPAEPLPELSSIGHEARGRLPPLKVSMHVYSDDPSGRVVIIDGRRLREGDLIDERLRLVEIQRAGSVLELDGRRYRLARP